MNHAHRMGPRLSALHDGDLGPLRAWLLRRHLRRCGECQRLARAIRQQSAALRALGAAPPPSPEPFCSYGWMALRARLRACGAAQPGELAGAGTSRRGLLASRALAATTVLGVVLVAGHQLRWHGAGGLGRAPVNTDVRISIAEEEFRRAEEPYERALAQLRGLLSREQRGWTAAQRREFREVSLALGEATLASQRLARSRPADAAAQELLYQAYLREIDYLQRALQEFRAPSPMGEVGVMPASYTTAAVGGGP